MAHGLARRGWDVTYACPGYLHRRAQRIRSGLDLPGTLRVLEPPALPGGGRLAVIAACNAWSMHRALKSKIPQNNDYIVFNDPRWASLAHRLPARRRLFDCMDDLSAIAPSAKWAEEMERHALEIADRVWTGTWSLAQKLSDRHAHVRFIPCGVEAERFAAPDPASIEQVAADLPPGEGPLAGYFGVLNERFDLARVEALLASEPWRVLLIGPATSRAPALPDNPRLHWIGPRPYTQLPAYLAHFDLSLIPYDTQGPNRFLYPVKALEYLAGGKPVLATPLPDVVRFLGDYVELADAPEDWRAAGGRLIRDREPALEKARRGQAYARSRTWDAMLDEMEEDLRD